MCKTLKIITKKSIFQNLLFSHAIVAIIKKVRKDVKHLIHIQMLYLTKQNVCMKKTA